MSEDAFLRIAFVVAVAATLGSLYFSEVAGYPPCILCWYQRIAMYPLVLLFGTSLWTGEKAVWKLSSGLVLVGLAIAVYHNLLYYQFLPESIAPCQQGISCTSKQVELLGFITIPLMSLTAFTLLTSFNVFVLSRRCDEEQK